MDLSKIVSFLLLSWIMSSTITFMIWLVLARQPGIEIIKQKCKCPEDTCNETYIGETKRRIQERIIDHNKRDKKSHILQHTRDKKHKHVWTNNFEIIGANYKTTYKRRISEALHIKQYKPTLNIQEKSVALKLFNWIY